ncbi:MAG: hypothetical protein LBK47_05655 [Prevotellaceae bacterium]|jgi:hypothetical protein|nr:hypothetical protein [Prevotellaceae bacterium]
MKIIECCPFFKENLLAAVHIKESSKWVDEIHIMETDYTHQYKEKPFYFDLEPSPKVFYHQAKVKHLFRPARKYIPYLRPFNKVSKWFPVYFRNTSWYNEAVHRKLASSVDFSDNDIILFPDIDEIVNPVYADRLVEEVKKRGIATIKLHFSLFYFNLFSLNWGGAKDYSYRIIALTGKVFREQWKKDSDWLRKSGERGQLTDSVYCFDDFMGFHHSWLGDAASISQKLGAYSHADQKEYNDIEYIQTCLRNKQSIFPGHKLEVNDNIKLLDAVEALRESNPQLFI